MEVSGEGARGPGAAIPRMDAAEEMGLGLGARRTISGWMSLGQAIDKVARGEGRVENGFGARSNITLIALLREIPATVTVVTSTTPADHAGSVDLALRLWESPDADIASNCQQAPADLAGAIGPRSNITLDSDSHYVSLPALGNTPQADVSHFDTTAAAVSEYAVTTASASCPAAATSRELTADATAGTGSDAPAQLANGTANAIPTDNPPPYSLPVSPATPSLASDSNAYHTSPSPSLASDSNACEHEASYVADNDPVPTYFPGDPLLPGYPTKTKKKTKKAAKKSQTASTSPPASPSSAAVDLAPVPTGNRYLDGHVLPPPVPTGNRYLHSHSPAVKPARAMYTTRSLADRVLGPAAAPSNTHWSLASAVLGSAF